MRRLIERQFVSPTRGPKGVRWTLVKALGRRSTRVHRNGGKETVQNLA